MKQFFLPAAKAGYCGLGNGLSEEHWPKVNATNLLSGSTYTGGPATTNITNPFKGLTGMTGSLSTSSTLSPSSYLLTNPEYSGVTEGEIPGELSDYNALNARLQVHGAWAHLEWRVRAVASPRLL